MSYDVEVVDYVRRADYAALAAQLADARTMLAATERDRDLARDDADAAEGNWARECAAHERTVADFNALAEKLAAAEVRLVDARLAAEDVMIQRGKSAVEGTYLTSEAAMLRLFKALDAHMLPPTPPTTNDGTDSLCLALYGRRATPGDWLGGSQARMLHDATRALADAEARLERARGAWLDGGVCSLREQCVGESFPVDPMDAALAPPTGPREPVPETGARPKAACPKCGGTGTYTYEMTPHEAYDGGRGFVTGPCPECHGDGTGEATLGERLMRVASGRYVVALTVRRDGSEVVRYIPGEGGVAAHGPTPDAALAALEAQIGGGDA